MLMNTLGLLESTSALCTHKLQYQATPDYLLTYLRNFFRMDLG